MGGGNDSSPECLSENDDALKNFEHQTYAIIYSIILLPGLIGNVLALWVFHVYVKETKKAVIFMINLAVADLLHVLSLPLRIYYYFTHTWPFGHTMCLLCFYLKYLNMYAGIAFLVCISIQRCAFLRHPFCAKSWKRRYDVRISAIVWLVVGLCCLPFILMRTGSNSGSAADSSAFDVTRNASTNGITSLVSHHDQPANGSSCFKDLPTRKLGLRVAVPMMVFAELLGFVLPLVIVLVCSCLIRRSLRHTEEKSGCRALRMVRVCTAVFLVCFAPYHVNFLLYMMVSQGLIVQCQLVLAVLRFHPITLCIASLNCCLNPLVYYFLTTEFRERLVQRGSILRGRLMSWESTSSG